MISRSRLVQSSAVARASDAAFARALARIDPDFADPAHAAVIAARETLAAHLAEARAGAVSFAGRGATGRKSRRPRASEF